MVENGLQRWVKKSTTEGQARSKLNEMAQDVVRNQEFGCRYRRPGEGDPSELDADNVIIVRCQARFSDLDSSLTAAR